MTRARNLVDQVLERDEASVLDVVDHVLNKGVTATGDLTLGVAGVDLVYVRLSALLCAADRVLPPPAASLPKRAGARRGGRRRARSR